MDQELGKGYSFDLSGDLEVDTVTVDVDLPKDVETALNEFFNMLSSKLEVYMKLPTELGIYTSNKLFVIVDTQSYMSLDSVEREDYCINAVDSILSYLKETGGVIHKLVAKEAVHDYRYDSYLAKFAVYVLVIKE